MTPDPLEAVAQEFIRENFGPSWAGEVRVGRLTDALRAARDQGRQDGLEEVKGLAEVLSIFQLRHWLDLQEHGLPILPGEYCSMCDRIERAIRVHGGRRE